MGLISPRDFVDVITTRETEEGISTNGKCTTVSPRVRMELSSAALFPSAPA